MGQQKRERKLTGPNTLLPVRRTKDREELLGCGLADPLLEAGGIEGQKGAKLVPETASPTKLQTGFQFLTKDFLKFWMLNIHWEGRS